MTPATPRPDAGPRRRALPPARGADHPARTPPWSRHDPAERVAWESDQSSTEPTTVSSAKAYRSEDALPVVPDAGDGPAVRGRSLEGLLGAGGVVELAIGVVVKHEQA